MLLIYSKCQNFCSIAKSASSEIGGAGLRAGTFSKQIDQFGGREVGL
jgi:hypothetical protein